MSGSSKSQTSTLNSNTATGPYTPAVGDVQSLINGVDGQIANTGFNPTSQDNSALSSLMGNAQNGNPYAAGINSLASNLLAGGGANQYGGYTTRGLNQLQSSLSPIANQSTNPYDNQAFQQLQGTLTNDITNQIKSQYAGAGYSPTSSGDFAQQLGRGISQGVAPAFVDAQNNLTSQRMAAANPLYEAGASTTGILSGLNQTGLSNQLQGVGTSTDALNANDSAALRQLQVGQMGRQLPLSNIGNLESLLLPIAQLGGTSNTNATQQTQQQSNPGLLGTIGQAAGIAGSLFGGGGMFGPGMAGSNLLGWLGTKLG